eukprot:2933165-Amphidinium_carterae.1
MTFCGRCDISTTEENGPLNLMKAPPRQTITPCGHDMMRLFAQSLTLSLFGSTVRLGMGC